MKSHVPAVNLKFLITTRLFSIFCKKRPLTCWWKKKVNFKVKNLKRHLPAVNLKFFITTPNFTSNFETHKIVGENFREYIQVDIYMFYIPTKYEEHWRILFIPCPIPSIYPSVNSALHVSSCKSALDPEGTLQRFDVKLVSASMIFKITIYTWVSKANFKIKFLKKKTFLRFSKKTDESN